MLSIILNTVSSISAQHKAFQALRSPLSLMLLLYACSLNAQAPDWRWARFSEGADHNEVRSVASDAAGNVYACGFFRSTSTRFGNVTLTNSGPGFYEIFLVKYNPEGNVLWAKSAGGSEDDRAHAVTTDAAGNVYLTGYFAGTASFGGITLNSTGGADFFLAKYDPQGNVSWVKKEDGASTLYDAGNALAADAQGNVWVAGIFNSNSMRLGGNSLQNLGSFSSDYFLAKYDAAGNVRKVFSAGSNMNDEALAIALDSDGRPFITGFFQGTSLSLGAVTLNNRGGSDLFIAQYDTAGNVLWAKGVESAGIGGNDRGSTVAIDAAGNRYVAGHFYDHIRLGMSNLNSIGDADWFLVKYDHSGNALWAKSAGGMGEDLAEGIALDSMGNPTLVGRFSSSMFNFGPGGILLNVGAKDIAIVQYDPNGNPRWAKSASGPIEDACFSICAGPRGALFAGGMSASPMLIFGSDTLRNTGSGDAIVLKFDNLTSSAFENLSPLHLTLSPNPMNGVAVIMSNRPLRQGAVQIFNMQGQLVREMNNLTGRRVELRREELPVGVYIVRLSEKGRFLVSRGLMIED